MYSVTKRIDFCYGHRLLNYNGKCRNLHGHNGKAVVTLETDHLDELVIDLFQVVEEVDLVRARLHSDFDGGDVAQDRGGPAPRLKYASA